MKVTNLKATINNKVRAIKQIFELNPVNQNILPRVKLCVKLNVLTQ